MQASGKQRKDFLLVLRSHLPHKTEAELARYEDRLDSTRQDRIGSYRIAEDRIG
jgi:hypothetical protein